MKAPTALLPRRADAKRDPHDGTCTVCGLLWPNPKEEAARHVCPPGFRVIPETGRYDHLLREQEAKAMSRLRGPDDLRTPEAMLETLHLAYQHVLDHLDELAISLELQKSRLTPEQNYELGRRLAVYWAIKSP